MHVVTLTIAHPVHAHAHQFMCTFSDNYNGQTSDIWRGILANCLTIW